MSFQVNKGPKNLEALSRSRSLPTEQEAPLRGQAMEVRGESPQGGSFPGGSSQGGSSQGGSSQGGSSQGANPRGGNPQSEAGESSPGNAAGGAAANAAGSAGQSRAEAAPPQQGAAPPEERTDLDILLEQAGVSPEEGNYPQADPDLELGTGFLAVNVTSGRGLLPIEGAVVTITTQQTLGQLVWARAITNSSGQILPVALPAPPRLFSQYPETPQQLAYGRYNVYVQARNMIPNLRQNVEIFDGITSIQNIDLTPIAASTTEESLDVIDEGQNYDL